MTLGTTFGMTLYATLRHRLCSFPSAPFAVFMILVNGSENQQVDPSSHQDQQDDVNDRPAADFTQPVQVVGDVVKGALRQRTLG